jgi:hypothetical protein
MLHPVRQCAVQPGRSPRRRRDFGGGGGSIFSAPDSPIHHALFSTSPLGIHYLRSRRALVRGRHGDRVRRQIRLLTLPPLPDLDPGNGDDEDGDRAPCKGSRALRKQQAPSRSAFIR